MSELSGLPVATVAKTAALTSAQQLLKGRWRPSKAREDELEHDQAVQRELAELRAVH